MIEWIYLIGFAWFWRYHVGYAMHEMAGSKPDGADFAFALFFGTIGCIAWPITVAGRGVYILWHKYMADDSSILGNFFPEAKKIETKFERIKRQQKEESRRQHEQKIAISAARREINDHERANGIPLTEWTD